MLKDVIQPFQIVDDAPLAVADFHLFAPLLHAIKVDFGITNIVPKLGHVQGDNFETLELKRHITNMAFGQIFL